MQIMNDPYVYLRENALPTIFCEEIISIYENNKELHNPGTTIGGINKNVKDTTDITIDLNKETYPLEMQNIIRVVQDEISHHLSEYYKCVNAVYKDEDDKIQKKPLTLDSILIQKYDQNIGKYIYHTDSFAFENRSRMITFIFYLNNVDIGGETEFMNTYKIKPKQGSILLFPSTWTYHHRGNMPISDSKYIITGWLYAKT